MGAIRDIQAGNTAVVDFEFHPTGTFGNITTALLMVRKSDATETVGFVTALAVNSFRGTYNVPDTGPNGPWVFRWESTDGPYASGEQRFNVVGSMFTTP